MHAASKQRRSAALKAAAALWLLTGLAHAQEALLSTPCEPQSADNLTPDAQAERLSYAADFFSPFNPQTALDMVRQTPGFTLDGGDNRRGFSGAVGNLLIDGTRPSAKSQSVEEILSRIPASQVVRIELLRGAEVAGDASGQAVLLNVVRTTTAGASVWEAGAEYTDRLAPRGEASYSGRYGQVEYGIGASIFTADRSQPGGRVLTNAAGAITETVDALPSRELREAGLSANLASPFFGGHFGATGEISAHNFRSDNALSFFDALGAPTRSFKSDFEEAIRGFEIGLNYDREIGLWSMDLVGLVTRSALENEELAVTNDGAGVEISNLTQSLREERGETIVRGSFARNRIAAHRFEFGGEVAFNSLEQTLGLVGSPPPAAIPNANLLVEEERAELFGVHTWQSDDGWSVETRLAWETSTLTFSGDTNQSVEFSFWKPSLQVTRAFGNGSQVRLRVHRDVGQLNFGDFTSSAAIADERIVGGNPDLAPQTDWRLELGADIRFQGGAALGLTLTQHRYSDVADVIKLIDTRGTPDPADDRAFDAPGNIGDGVATSLDVNLSLPLTSLTPGGRLTLNGFLWQTEVTDPVTGRARIISNRPESQVSVNFRQDLSQFSWGVSYYEQGEIQAYRLNEIDTSEEGPAVNAWIETRVWGNARLRLSAENLAGRPVDRDRLFFSPDRSGSVLRRDLRRNEYDYDPWLIVAVSGSF